MKQNKKELFSNFVKNKILPNIESNEKEISDNESKEEKSKSFINDDKILIKFINFFNIREQFILMKLNNKIKNIILQSKTYLKYLKIRNELNNDIKIVEKDKKKESQIISISKRIRNTKNFSINQIYNRKIEEKKDNKVLLNVSNKELPKKKVDFEKIKFEDLFCNQGEKIKKIIKKNKLNSLEERIIINGIIEAKLLHKEEKIQNFILNNINLGNSISYFIPSFINLNENCIIRLNLSGNNFSLKDMKYLSNILSLNSFSLSLLDLSKNKLDDNSSTILFPSLSECKNLSMLNLSNNQIGSEGFSFLEDFFTSSERLETLILGKNLIGPQGIYYLNEFLLINPNISIRTLDVSYNGLQLEGIKLMCDYIIKNKKIISLFIGGNCLNKKGINLLSETLLENKDIPLAYLFLENNNLDKGIEDVSNIISNHQFISLIDLKNNNLKNEGICKLFENLNTESKILTLDLSSNKIGEKGLNSIYEYLKNNNILRKLILNENIMDEKCCLVLKKMLQDSNIYLKNLTLQNCKIESNHNLLFDGLKKNLKLDSINLSNNNIGIIPEKLNILTDCLKENVNLKEIILDSNSLNNESIKIILEGFSDSTSLKFISLKNNKFTKNIFYAVFQVVEKNKTLKRFDLTNSGFEKSQIEELEYKIKENSIVKKEVKQKLMYDDGLDDDKKNKNESEDNNEENEIIEDVSSL